MEGNVIFIYWIIAGIIYLVALVLISKLLEKWLERDGLRRLLASAAFGAVLGMLTVFIHNYSARLLINPFAVGLAYRLSGIQAMNGEWIIEPSPLALFVLTVITYTLFGLVASLADDMHRVYRDSEFWNR